MPTIVHFEIPSDNVEKTRKFYSELFGWNIEKWTGAESMPEGMDYWTVTAKINTVMMLNKNNNPAGFPESYQSST
jgi:predicted enzyme related to lactoylglutathione lyase